MDIHYLYHYDPKEKTMSDDKPKETNQEEQKTHSPVKMEHHIPPPIFSVGGAIAVRKLSREECDQEIRVIKKEIAPYFLDSCQFIFKTRMGNDAHCVVDVTCDTPRKRKVSIKVSKLIIPGHSYPAERSTDWLWSAYHDLLALIRRGERFEPEVDALAEAQKVISKARGIKPKQANSPYISGNVIPVPATYMGTDQAITGSQMVSTLTTAIPQRNQPPRGILGRLLWVLRGK
jgi:hypothetical protein